MDQTYILLLVLAVVIVAVTSAAIMQRRQRDKDATTPADSPFATSTEGMKICPKCAMGNLWTDRNCVSCGAALKG